MEETANQVWSGTSDPQEYNAIVDTSIQCTVIPSSYRELKPICISEVTGGCQELSLLEGEVSLTRNEWHKHLIFTGPGVPRILGTDSLKRGYFKDTEGYR